MNERDGTRWGRRDGEEETGKKRNWTRRRGAWGGSRLPRRDRPRWKWIEPEVLSDATIRFASMRSASLRCDPLRLALLQSIPIRFISLPRTPLGWPAFPNPIPLTLPARTYTHRRIPRPCPRPRPAHLSSPVSPCLTLPRFRHGGVPTPRRSGWFPVQPRRTWSAEVVQSPAGSSRCAGGESVLCGGLERGVVRAAWVRRSPGGFVELCADVGLGCAAGQRRPRFVSARRAGRLRVVRFFLTKKKKKDGR